MLMFYILVGNDIGLEGSAVGEKTDQSLARSIDAHGGQLQRTLSGNGYSQEHQSGKLNNFYILHLNRLWNNLHAILLGAREFK